LTIASAPIRSGRGARRGHVVMTACAAYIALKVS
jgi:hypothetical protein